MVLQHKLDSKTQEETHYILLVRLNNLLLLRNDALAPSVGEKLPLVQPSRQNRIKLETRKNKSRNLSRIDQEIRYKEYKKGDNDKIS